MNLAGVANQVGLPLKRKGFEKVFRSCLNPTAIQENQRDLYISCKEARSPRRRFFKLNDLTYHQMKSVLLATTAVPGLYEPVLIDNISYVDPMKSELAPLRPWWSSRLLKGNELSKFFQVKSWEMEFMGHLILDLTC